MSQRNTGKWSEEEQEWFLKGIDEFGVDYKKLEEHMGGVRDVRQIAHYYKTGIKKDPDMFSPGKTPKKRSAPASAVKTPSKKSKATTPAASARKNTRKSAPASAIKTPKRAPPPKDDSGEDSSDEINVTSPPPVSRNRAASAKKPAAKKSTPAPTKRTTRSAAATVKVADEMKEKENMSISDFFKKEEVQTVIAGALGFVFVLVVKKLMA
ncbi:MAG: hypothetical protein SGILL_000100 [Bacillariaceae sp.]